MAERCEVAALRGQVWAGGIPLESFGSKTTCLQVLDGSNFGWMWMKPFQSEHFTTLTVEFLLMHFCFPKWFFNAGVSFESLEWCLYFAEDYPLEEPLFQSEPPRPGLNATITGQKICVTTPYPHPMKLKKNSKHNSSTCNIQCKRIHPLKLTHLLKRNHLKRKFIHQPSIFRGYVSFQRVYCLFSIFPSQSIFRCLLVGHLGREWFPVPTGAQRNTRRSRLVEGHAMAFTRVPWCG